MLKLCDNYSEEGGGAACSERRSVLSLHHRLLFGLGSTQSLLLQALSHQEEVRPFLLLFIYCTQQLKLRTFFPTIPKLGDLISSISQVSACTAYSACSAALACLAASACSACRRWHDPPTRRAQRRRHFRRRRCARPVGIGVLGVLGILGVGGVLGLSASACSA